jgi:uncharacterized damage-inducible protein DinB
MSISDGFISELQHEAATTRKCLERIPESSFDWKPHEKSMSMVRLATHVAEMFDWVKETVSKTEMDFATQEYKPFEPQTTADLVEFFDKRLAGAIEALQNVPDEAMFEKWRLRNGEEIFFEMMRVQVLRGMVFNHILHHRGQLSVYLRMNDIPVPALYGPSADEGVM